MSSTSPKKRKLSNEKSEDIINLSLDNSPKRSKIEQITQENVSVPDFFQDNSLIFDQNNNMNVNQILNFDFNDTVHLEFNLDPQQVISPQLNLQQIESDQLILQQTIDFQQTIPQQIINSQQAISQQQNIQIIDIEQENLGLVDLEQLDSQKFAQQENDPKIKLGKLLSQVDLIKKSLKESIKLDHSEYQLKDYLQPNRKKDLFTADEIFNKQRIVSNFLFLLNKTMDNEQMTDLFDENEINIMDDLMEKDEESVAIFLFLFFKKNKWSFIESINLTSKKMTSEQLLKKLEKLENDGFLLGSNGIENLEQGMYLLESSQISEVVKSCFNIAKSKTSNISSMLNFVKKNKTALNGKSLEESKLIQIKKMLKKRVFKVNPAVYKIFYKLLVTQFEPIEFNNNIYYYFFNLVANLKDDSFAEKYPILKDVNNQVIENNLVDSIYNCSSDLNRFTEACFIELNLKEKNYDKLKNFTVDIISKFEECLKTNYLKDIKLDEWLFQFTCVGRMLNVLKYLDTITDVNLDKLIGKELRELIKLLIDDCIEEEQEEIFNLKDINYEIKDLDLSEEYSTKLEDSDKKKKTDKAINTIEEELAIKHLKDEFEIDNVIKNASNLFEIYLFDLFYDVIYDPNIKNTFIYKFQKFPLDINFKSFYENRKNNFESKIKEYKTNKIKFLIDKLKKTRTDFKCLKNIISSNKFSFDKIKELFSFIKKEQLMNIIIYLAKDYNKRKNSSCDLIFYDVDNLDDENKSSFKFIELLHGDNELDQEKINWIKFLKKLNFEVEIYCIDNDNRSMC